MPSTPPLSRLLSFLLFALLSGFFPTSLANPIPGFLPGGYDRPPEADATPPNVYPVQVSESFLGNPNYHMYHNNDPATGMWAFAVFSDGLVPENQPQNPPTLDELQVDTRNGKLIVYLALNGMDQIKPRLKMRQVLKECWLIAGMQPNELKEIVGAHIENENMRKQLRDCRRDMGLSVENRDEFEVSATDTDKGKKKCWDGLQKTIFGKAIAGAISEFGVGKKLVKVKVEIKERNRPDYLYFYLS